VEIAGVQAASAGHYILMLKRLWSFVHGSHLVVSYAGSNAEFEIKDSVETNRPKGFGIRGWSGKEDEERLE
jgi:hypothetical protein